MNASQELIIEASIDAMKSPKRPGAIIGKRSCAIKPKTWSTSTSFPAYMATAQSPVSVQATVQTRFIRPPPAMPTRLSISVLPAPDNVAVGCVIQPMRALKETTAMKKNADFFARHDFEHGRVADRLAQPRHAADLCQGERDDQEGEDDGEDALQQIGNDGGAQSAGHAVGDEQHGHRRDGQIGGRSRRRRWR